MMTNHFSKEKKEIKKKKRFKTLLSDNILQKGYDSVMKIFSFKFDNN